MEKGNKTKNIKYNIIYLVPYVRIGDGVSTALFKVAKRDVEIAESQLVVTQFLVSYPEWLNVVTLHDKEKIKEFVQKSNVLIHYFKGMPSLVLWYFNKIVKRNFPTILTCCQSPSFKGIWVTPYELKHNNLIVFIDKAGYNNPVLSFLESENKRQIYFGREDTTIIPNPVKPDGDDQTIIYGRGSTLSKCPQSMFEVFDKIDIVNKEFHIVGIPEGDNWVRKEAEKRDNVKVFGILPVEEWENKCNTFDVFLYQLPNDSHASLDGTLGIAMLLGKPAVYMGCEAPKERFRNGENGFVANSVDEMAEYATRLGRSSHLRKEIGESGRLSSLRDFSADEGKKKFHEAYALVYSKKKQKVKIPLSYYWKFYKYGRQPIINYWHYYLDIVISDKLRLRKRKIIEIINFYVKNLKSKKSF